MLDVCFCAVFSDDSCREEEVRSNPHLGHWRALRSHKLPAGGLSHGLTSTNVVALGSSSCEKKWPSSPQQPNWPLHSTATQLELAEQASRHCCFDVALISHLVPRIAVWRCTIQRTDKHLAPLCSVVPDAAVSAQQTWYSCNHWFIAKGAGEIISEVDQFDAAVTNREVPTRNVVSVETSRDRLETYLRLVLVSSQTKSSTSRSRLRRSRAYSWFLCASKS